MWAFPVEHQEGVLKRDIEVECINCGWKNLFSRTFLRVVARSAKEYCCPRCRGLTRMNIQTKEDYESIVGAFPEEHK